MIGLILLQIALIALNAIFAGTEIAVISVNETKSGKGSGKAATSVPDGC